MKTSIIIYDSDCAFCTWCVRFVLKHDSAKKFSFAGLTSNTARQFFVQHQITDTEKLWLVEGEDDYFIKSDAALRIVASCGGVYRFVNVFFIIPRFVRDFFYDVISRLRKRLIPNNICPMIPEEEQGRFLE